MPAWHSEQDHLLDAEEEPVLSGTQAVPGEAGLTVPSVPPRSRSGCSAVSTGGWMDTNLDPPCSWSGGGSP